MKTFFVPVLFCLIVVCSSRAQMPGPPADGDSTNRLSVQIDLRWGTKVFHAPATMDILAYVGLRPRPRAGDVVRVEFFADAKSLGSAKAIWHDEVRPTAPPGYAVPMHILAAQFYPAEWVWNCLLYTSLPVFCWSSSFGLFSKTGLDPANNHASTATTQRT